MRVDSRQTVASVLLAALSVVVGATVSAGSVAAVSATVVCSGVITATPGLLLVLVHAARRAAVLLVAVRMNWRRWTAGSVFVDRTVLRDTDAMNWISHILANGDMDEGGGTNYMPFLLVAAAVVVAVLVQRSRLRKAKARVNVRRVLDVGRVALDRLPDSHSLAVGVRVHADHTGTQTLLEAAT